MKLNHLNLTVTDPVKTQEFLIKYFALKPRGKGNHNMAFLSDDNGIVLSLMNPKVGRESEVKYPATFHVGFIQESEQAVDEINQRLKAAGFDVPLPSRQHGSGRFYGGSARVGYLHRNGRRNDEPQTLARPSPLKTTSFEDLFARGVSDA